MRSGLDQQNLIEPETQDVARARIDRFGAQLGDPEVEQAQVAQYAVEKLKDKGAVGGTEGSASKNVRDNLVGKLGATAPAVERLESERAAGRHKVAQASGSRGS